MANSWGKWLMSARRPAPTAAGVPAGFSESAAPQITALFSPPSTPRLLHAGRSGDRPTLTRQVRLATFPSFAPVDSVFLSTVYPMNTSQYLDLSTRLARELKEWIAHSRDHRGISIEELVTLNAAAEIVQHTTERVARLNSD